MPNRRDPEGEVAAVSLWTASYNIRRILREKLGHSLSVGILKMISSKRIFL